MDMEMNAREELVIMMYTLWIQKYGLHHSEQLLEAFEGIWADQKEFMNMVQLAGNLCMAKHFKDMGL